MHHQAIIGARKQSTGKNQTDKAARHHRFQIIAAIVQRRLGRSFLPFRSFWIVKEKKC
jgi:hypothetical protein